MKEVSWNFEGQIGGEIKRLGHGCSRPDFITSCFFTRSVPVFGLRARQEGRGRGDVFSGAFGGGVSKKWMILTQRSFPNKQLSVVAAKGLSKMSPATGRKESAGISIGGSGDDVGAPVFSLFPMGKRPKYKQQQTNDHICIPLCLQDAMT